MEKEKTAVGGVNVESINGWQRVGSLATFEEAILWAQTFYGEWLTYAPSLYDETLYFTKTFHNGKTGMVILKHGTAYSLWKKEKQRQVG